MLQDYLNKVLQQPAFGAQVAMVTFTYLLASSLRVPVQRSFLGVSSLSFVRGLGNSLRESRLSKYANDDYRGQSIFLRVLILCDPLKLFDERKWFVIKDSYVVYIQLKCAREEEHGPGSTRRDLH